MKIGITGAAGFIGQNLCLHLNNTSEYEVIPIVRSSDNVPEVITNLSYRIADVRDVEGLKKAFDNIDVVINLAALFNHPDKTLDEYIEVNVNGVGNVLAASEMVGVDRVIHCSTIGVATGGEMPFSEETDYCPPQWDKYETTKCEGEKLALEFSAKTGFPVVVIRPAQVYGPGDKSKLKFYRMVKKGVIVNPGDALKHLIYIDDLCRAFEAAISCNEVIGQAVIIAGDGPTSLKELVSIVAGQLGVAYPKIVIPALPMTLFASLVESAFNFFNKKPPIFRRSMDFFTKSVSFKTERMNSVLNFTPHVSVEEGVRRTAEWYKLKGLI